MVGITEQTYPIACKGGLDLTTNTQELLQKPGWATRLVNFEPSTDGGYRRINGYIPLGSGRTPGTELTRIKGITWVDNKALVVCHEDAVYFSYDLVNFIQINVAMDLAGANSGGMDFTEVTAATKLPRTSSYHYDFQLFRQGTGITLMGTSEGTSPFWFQITGTTLADSTYYYKELSLTSGTLTGATHSEKFKDQFVIAGMDDAPAEIYYSDILNPDDFEGANAGAIGFNDVVMGLKMFRESLYVFCRNSIHKVDGLSSGSPQRIPVTTKIGCIDGNSIQELAGDLVFLAPDGLRTLAATSRIGDVNIASLSATVASKLRIINRNIESYDVRSETIKNKAQYRLFFKGKVGETVGAYSIIMYMSTNTQGSIAPEFSELTGFEIASIDNGFYKGKERTITGDRSGNIWFHDEGNDFNGSLIYFLYETPFFAINDPGFRKNIHKVTTYLKIEGDASFNLALKYDYDSRAAYQPAPYPVGPLIAPALYGTSVYTNNNISYGTEKSPVVDTLTEGSGKTVALRIYPSGQQCDPFSLQGFDISYVQSGRI